MLLARGEYTSGTQNTVSIIWPRLSLRIIGGVSYWVLCVNTLNDALFPKWKDGKGKDSCEDTDPEEDAVQVPYVLPDPG